MIITDKERNTATVIARQVSRKWRLTDFEDMQAELYTWLVIKASKGVLERYRTEQYGEQKLYTGLKRYAIKYAIKETEKITGQKLMPYNENGEHYTYTIENIKNALPFLWDYEQITDTHIKENPQTGQALKQYQPETKVADIMFSIKIAIEKLNYSEQILLQYKYREDKTFKQIAELLDIK